MENRLGGGVDDNPPRTVPAGRHRVPTAQPAMGPDTAAPAAIDEGYGLVRHNSGCNHHRVLAPGRLLSKRNRNRLSDTHLWYSKDLGAAPGSCQPCLCF